ncbi:MAG: hypothetical protein QFC55_04920, partial [Chloroflexota bacterium]|nr:hypothetical protein [Chloroflexota bacterium]
MSITTRGRALAVLLGGAAEGLESGADGRLRPSGDGMADIAAVRTAAQPGRAAAALLQQPVGGECQADDRLW